MLHKLKRIVAELAPSVRDPEMEETPDAAPTRDADATDDDGFVGVEERIVALLDDRNGTAWQSEIRTELGWSPSKTSRVLSAMEDDDRIERYRVGREKVVCIPGQEPDWVNDTWSKQYEQ